MSDGAGDRWGGEGGFSLVEISVTIAVIGILAAIAMPSVLSIMPRIRLHNSATTLANEIALIRGRALSKGTKYKIVFSTHGGSPSAYPDSYALWRRSVTECPAPDYWCPVATSRLSGIEIVGVSNFSGAEADTVVADWDGSINVYVGEQGTITLQTPPRPPRTVGDFLRRIAVDSIGRVTVEHSTDGLTWVRV